MGDLKGPDTTPATVAAFKKALLACRGNTHPINSELPVVPRYIEGPGYLEFRILVDLLNGGCTKVSSQLRGLNYDGWDFQLRDVFDGVFASLDRSHMDAVKP